MNYRKPWNKENIEFLIKWYPYISNKTLCLLLGLTNSQITSKANNLSLKKDKETLLNIYNKSNATCDFSNEEIESLLKQYKDYKKVSEITGLTVCALACRNSKYWHINITSWTKEKTNQLIELFPNKPDKEIAEILDMSCKQVQSKARKLKLKKDPDYLKILYQDKIKYLEKTGQKYIWPKGHKGFKLRYGKNHHNYKHDRTQITNKKYLGKFSNKIREIIRKRQCDHCLDCNIFLNNQGEFHHVIPIWAGGKGKLDNCILLCKECHQKRTHQDLQLTNNWNDKDKIKTETEYYLK